jgi:hypothetical protein
VQLTEHRAVRVGGAIDQHHERQPHADGDAPQDTEGQLSADDDRGDTELAIASGTMTAQTASPARKSGNKQSRR